MTVRECYEELGSDFDMIRVLDSWRQHWQIKMQRQHFVQHIH